MTVVSDNFEPPPKIWDWILSNLQQEMSRGWFETWVKPAVPLSFAGGVFTLGCHNHYTIDWLNSRLKTTIERHLSGLLGQPIELAIVLLADVQAKDESLGTTLLNRMRQVLLPMILTNRYTPPCEMRSCNPNEW